MDTLDRITRALGPPQVLHEVGSGRDILAAFGRWRHGGACVDLSGAKTFQLVFNVSGGQRVELQRHEHSVSNFVRAGSVGIVSPGDPTGISVTGQADVLQIIITSELMEAVTGRPVPFNPPQLTSHEPELQAAAAQALVALARNQSESAAELSAIVCKIACRFAQPAVLSPTLYQGGLSPAARRSVRERMDDRLPNGSRSVPTLAELAATAGLSVHHFIKAFRRNEGATPYARAIALRIDHAFTSLLRVGARVDEISEEAGFSSPSHFVSTFRRHTGVTPGALRDAARSGL